MNIQILDSWLREHLITKATPKQIAEKLSLTSVSIERIDKVGNDFLYDIEITTNRPDLISVVGIAREAGAVLPQHDIPATFIPPKLPKPVGNNKETIKIENDPSMINRICAVVMEVQMKSSPKEITNRLESTGIRSLNNVIDVTNYVMRTIGHPTHVFDYDRLATKKLIIRSAKKGEKITTLDKKTYELIPGDIIAENNKGEIVDLIGIMGLENSVVTNSTKRILFFIDNNIPTHIRNTSMRLAIRTEAAQLNEKGVDAETAYDALLYGIKLFQKVADAKIISNVIDIYPNKILPRKIVVEEPQINTLVGVTIPLKTSAQIMRDLGFESKIIDSTLEVTVPSYRSADIYIPEDVIEEIARVYGYHNLPSILPPTSILTPYKRSSDQFFWENKIKQSLKYWGFTEVYTYSMVSENMYEGDLKNAVTIKNPLSEEWTYMRISLVPSLLKTIAENKTRKTINIFEIANVYEKVPGNLPNEIRKLSAVIKKPNISFFEVKGIIEQLTYDIGIKNIQFRTLKDSEQEIEIIIGKEKIGEVEILNSDLTNFEIDVETLLRYATDKNTFIPLAKYPPILEDMTLIIPDTITVGEVISTIKRQSAIIKDVSLIDKYQSTRTFRIIYQHANKNLTNEEVKEIREKIIKFLQDVLNVKPKS